PGRAAVVQQALRRAGRRHDADAARPPRGVRSGRPHAEARPRERGGVLHPRRPRLRGARRRALRLAGGRSRDRAQQLRAPALQRRPGQAGAGAGAEVEADVPVPEHAVPEVRHRPPDRGGDSRGRGLRAAPLGDGLQPSGGLTMAWGESKNWLKGKANEKLYQGLLEDASGAPARNAKRKKIVHPEEMPWEMSRQGILKHLLNEKMNTRMETVDAYMQIIAPGSRSGKHRHLAEECVYVLEGRGYDLHQDCDVEITDTYHWVAQDEVKRYEWEAGDVIYIPPNTIHQHFNADPERPVRLISAINRVYRFCGLNDLEQIEDAPEYDPAVILTGEIVERYLERARAPA